MGLIKWSGIAITEGTGKIGGSVASRNSSGAIARNRVKGTNAKTNKQLTQRGAFSNIAAAWRGLTAGERLAWITAASSGEWPYQNRLGETKTPSGFQLFTRLNNNLAVDGKAPISAPPLKGDMGDMTLDTLTIDVSTEEITLTTSGTSGDCDLLLYATASLSPGVSRPSQFKLITIFGSDTPEDIYNYYLAVFGVPLVGSTVFIRLDGVNEDTGQRIVYGQLSATVVD